MADVYRAMDKLGCEITSVTRDLGSAEWWHAQWRVRDRRVRSRVFGAAGETELAAARAALVNAESACATLRRGGVSTTESDAGSGGVA